MTRSSLWTPRSSCRMRRLPRDPIAGELYVSMVWRGSARWRRTGLHRADGNRVASGVLFVTVEDTVLVAIDADAHPRARRGAGVGQLAVSLRGALPQAGIGDRRVVPPVAEEPARIDIVEITFFAVVAPALDHQIALPGPGAVDQEVDPRSGHSGVVPRERRLLPDDGGEVAVEGEQVLLDLLLLGFAHGAGGEPAGSRRRLVEARPVGGEAVETEDRRDAPVVVETEAADLIAQEGVAAGVRRIVRHSEHADFLVLIAEVGSFHSFPSAVESVAAIGAEEAWSGHAKLRVRLAV